MFKCLHRVGEITKAKEGNEKARELNCIVDDVQSFEAAPYVWPK